MSPRWRPGRRREDGDGLAEDEIAEDEIADDDFDDELDGDGLAEDELPEDEIADDDFDDQPAEEAFEEALEEGELTPAAESAALGAELEEEVAEEEARRAELAADGGPARHPKRPGPFRRLYRGETSFDFVGRRRWWFGLSLTIIVLGFIAFGLRGGLPLGIDFKGGTSWTVPANGASQSAVQNAINRTGLPSPTVEMLGSGSSEEVEVQAGLKNLNQATQQALTTKVTNALAAATRNSPGTVSIDQVGPTWGSQVTQRALIALVVFFLVVGVYISFRFEPKMALAAFIAMVHDLLITLAVYEIAGFQVSPDTVIAILTVLGYSLYDTVVVFDRVRDNTRGLGASGRMTYSEMVNLSMNQTLARSLNTSMVAILPVLAVLLIGAELLGATTLQDYGLALTVGLISGAYSSIFIASPVLAVLKEREPRYAAIRHRIETRGERLGLLTPAAAAALATAGTSRAATQAVLAGAGNATRRAPGGGRRGPLRPGESRRAASGDGRPSGRPAAPADAEVVGAPPAGQPSVGSANTSTGGVRSAGGKPPAGRTGGGRPSVSGRPSVTGRPPPRPRKGGGKSRKRR